MKKKEPDSLKIAALEAFQKAETVEQMTAVIKLLTKYSRLQRKFFWNEAVNATLNEVKKYDGLIPQSADREYLAQRVKEKLLYKLKKQYLKLQQ